LGIEFYLKFMIFEQDRVLQKFVDRAFNSIQNVFAIVADRNRNIAIP
jgi:hypothetical protein